MSSSRARTEKDVADWRSRARPMIVVGVNISLRTFFWNWYRGRFRLGSSRRSGYPKHLCCAVGHRVQVTRDIINPIGILGPELVPKSGLGSKLINWDMCQNDQSRVNGQRERAEPGASFPN